MPALKEMHRRILSNLDEMQERRETVIKEHEHNLLRHFRSKMYEVRSHYSRHFANILRTFLQLSQLFVNPRFANQVDTRQDVSAHITGFTSSFILQRRGRQWKQKPFSALDAQRLSACRSV